MCVQTYQSWAPQMDWASICLSCIHAASFSDQEQTGTKPWTLNLLPSTEFKPIQETIQVISLVVYLGQC